VELKDLASRNRAGKAVVNVGAGARVLLPQLVAPISDAESDLVAAATDSGRLLVFPLSELPLLPRGKGVKILNVHAGQGESLLAAVVLPPGAHLRVHSGKRYLNLKPSELDAYRGQRAQRGLKLPRGFQSVAALEVVR
jgi:topoisomerase IV subunit A